MESPTKSAPVKTAVPATTPNPTARCMRQWYASETSIRRIDDIVAATYGSEALPWEGFKVPASIRAVDDILVHPERLYSREEFQEIQGRLDKFRYEAVAKIGNALHPDIQKVFQKV